MSHFRTWSFKKRLLLGLPAVLVLVITASAYWLLHTASGAAWLWKQVEGIAAGAVHSSQLDGDLASGFTIRNLGYVSESVDLSVDTVTLEAGPGWWPVSIQVRSLDLRDMEIVIHSPAGQTDAETMEMDIRSALAALKLPVPLEVQNASLTNISLQQGDEPPATMIESILFQATLDDRLVVEQLDLITQGLEARLGGYLALEAPFELAISVEGRLEMSSETGEAGLMLPFALELSGDLDELQFSGASKKSGLELGGEALELVIAGSGSASGIQINHAALTGPGVDLGFNADLDWSSEPEARLSTVIRQLDLSPWMPDWPVGEYMTGELELNWSQTRLEILPGRLAVAGTDLEINIEADIDIEANSVDARLNWTGLSWPLASVAPEFSSPSGSLSVGGSFDQWTSAGQVQVQMADYPQGQFEIQGGGNRSSARLAILDGELLGGSVSGEATADWADSLVWDATIQTLGVNPEPLLPGWPGSLDAGFEIIAGSQPQNIQIKLASLQGRIRGVPVNVRGDFKIAGDDMTFDNVDIRTDEAVLLLDGNTAQAAGVTLKFNGYLPGVWLEGASGALEVEARYSSHADKPLLELQLEAQDLVWNGYRIREISLSSDGAGPLPALRLDALGVGFNDVFLDQLSLQLEPAVDAHKLGISLAGEDYVLSSELTVVPDNMEQPFAGNWRGTFDALEVGISQAYTFSLSEPAAIQWTPESASLGPVCLRETAAAKLCLSGDYQSSGDWSLVADLSTVPLDYLQEIFALDVHFEQYLEGRLEWHQPYDKAATGGADFRITAGRIVDRIDNDLLLETTEGRFAFALQNGNLESGVLDMEFPGYGFIDIDFDVQDISVDGARILRGRAITRLDDIRPVGELALPGIDDISGVFESNILLGGTLADPVFEGGFKLSDGFIHYAPIGLKLESIEFEGQVDKRDQGSFKGQFQAGEGIGLIDGHFLFGDLEQPRLDINFSGDQLLLLNTDALKINTETQLKLGFSPHRMDINGHIRIPSASLTPANLLLGAVNDSEDLVIDTPDGVEPETGEAPPEDRVYGQLEVSFGDDVFIKVPGIETNISGAVMFNWSGDSVPLAQGSYVLQGEVDVYGPVLQINNGHISFPGVPADNPLLSIRAQREIYGNTQIRAAGVQVIGTLKRPVLEAYTVPVTNEDRAWTLLVTGTDFDQGQGVGGFDVGTYIAPKLYVSYGISLFEDENVISARYDLKKGFGVKVTSGQRETGLDVSYTIDK